MASLAARSSCATNWEDIVTCKWPPKSRDKETERERENKATMAVHNYAHFPLAWKWTPQGAASCLHRIQYELQHKNGNDAANVCVVQLISFYLQILCHKYHKNCNRHSQRNEVEADADADADWLNATPPASSSGSSCNCRSPTQRHTAATAAAVAVLLGPSTWTW